MRDFLRYIVDAGLRAPDHGGPLPYRVIEVLPETPEMLADVFEAEKCYRDPHASEEDHAIAREHAARTSALLGVECQPALTP